MLAIYTENDGKGKLTFDQREAVAKMWELHEVICAMFGSYDFAHYRVLQDPRRKMAFILDTTNHILELEDGKARFKQHVTRLTQAFGLAVPDPATLAIRDDLAFLQAIKARIVKLDDSGRKPGKNNEEIETPIRQIIDDAIVSSKVVVVFDAAGIRKPNISVLSDSFLAEVQNIRQKNLALKQLLNDKIKVQCSTNTRQPTSTDISGNKTE